MKKTICLIGGYFKSNLNEKAIFNITVSLLYIHNKRVVFLLLKVLCLQLTFVDLN